MKIIAVAGGSGSGKTLFSKLLNERLQKSIILPLDQYYLDKPDNVSSEKYDFDIPQAFDFKLYRQNLNELIDGETIRMPQFEYISGKRTKKYVKVQPGNYLIIEGLYVLMYPSIRSLLSFSFFLESPLDIALSRRCLRDISYYRLSAEYSINQYLNFVRPAYFAHILTTKQFAKIVVTNNFNSRLDLFLNDFLKKNPF